MLNLIQKSVTSCSNIGHIVGDALGSGQRLLIDISCNVGASLLIINGVNN
jgi:hypothetical protein